MMNPTIADSPMLTIAGVGIGAHLIGAVLEGAGNGKVRPWIDMAGYIIALSLGVTYAFNVGGEMVRAVMNFRI